MYCTKYGDTINLFVFYIYVLKIEKTDAFWMHPKKYTTRFLRNPFMMITVLAGIGKAPKSNFPIMIQSSDIVGGSDLLNVEVMLSKEIFKI